MLKVVNAMGDACPIPEKKKKNAIKELSGAGMVETLVDNEIAVQNLQRFAEHMGFPATGEKLSDKEFTVTMHIGGEEKPEPEISCAVDARKKGMLVVLSANTMGTGEEKLGKALMKAFVFALTKQDVLPETILCYNTGAYLTTEGADTLEDLKLLESEGVTILTCGTCLDFYGLKEKLMVGGVTNMYDIVERMESAQIIVRP